jgi:hypothetical protein
VVKEYLDYLEKLNTLVDKDEILFKSASAIVMKDRKRMWDWTFWLSLVLAILSLGGTIVSMSACYYHHQGTWVTPLVIGMVCVVSWVLATTAASKSIDYYNVLLDLEYASPIDSSYAIVRNAIVDEGDEFMKKLFDWLQLYVLSSEDWAKYRYVLHVIDSLIEDYKIVESRENK